MISFIDSCRIPDLCQQYAVGGIRSHHYPMDATEKICVDELLNIIDDIRECIEKGRNILLQ